MKGMKSNDNFFFRPTAKAILDCGISGCRRAGERGWVSCERIHAVEFCILSLAACGLKQHPLPTATPTIRKSVREREREKESKTNIEKVHAGGRSLFLLAAFIGGFSVQKKSEGARERKRENEKRGSEKERQNGSVE